MLPETDGHTLEEIEMFYSKPGFDLFHRKISRIKKPKLSVELQSECQVGLDNEAFSKL